VCTPKKDYKFKALTRGEKEKWVEAIEKMTAKNDKKAIELKKQSNQEEDGVGSKRSLATQLSLEAVAAVLDDCNSGFNLQMERTLRQLKVLKRQVGVLKETIESDLQVSNEILRSAEDTSKATDDFEMQFDLAI